MADRSNRIARALDTLAALRPGDPDARESVRVVCAFVASADRAETMWLLRRLDRLHIDEERAGCEIRNLAEAPAAQRRAAFTRLRNALEPRRDVVLRHLCTAPGEVRTVVDLRAALLAALLEGPEAADLSGLDEDLRSFLAARIEVGALELRRLTWRDSAALLERLARREAVHAVRGWFDLKDRLDDDRRCYAFFHPSMPDAPLVFTEVALTDATPSSIQMLLDKGAPRVNPAVARAATFFSISNCEPGLSGIPFGNALIKRAVDVLRGELPQLRVFATLSPIPGFAAWVRGLGDKVDPVVREHLAAPAWQRNAAVTAALKEPVLRLAARYLLEAKRSDGAPLDAVARFHLANGALVERIAWLGDVTPRGIGQSFGAMVNYRYAADRIPHNQLAYAATFSVDATQAVRSLAAADPTMIDAERATPAGVATFITTLTGKADRFVRAMFARARVVRKAR